MIYIKNVEIVNVLRTQRYVFKMCFFSSYKVLKVDIYFYKLLLYIEILYMLEILIL